MQLDGIPKWHVQDFIISIRSSSSRNRSISCDEDFISEMELTVGPDSILSTSLQGFTLYLNKVKLNIAFLNIVSINEFTEHSQINFKIFDINTLIKQ